MIDYSAYYNNTDLKQKIINDGNHIFDVALKGYAGYVLKVDGIDKEVVIHTRYGEKNNNERKIFARKGEIQVGNLVEFDNEKWIIDEFTESDGIREWGVMKLCNHNLEFIIAGTNVQVGTDKFGRPIYEESNPVTYSYPCAIYNARQYYENNERQANVPDGRMFLILKNNYDEPIKEGNTFQLYGYTYFIYAIDRTKTYAGQDGIMVIHADKRTNE